MAYGPRRDILESLKTREGGWTGARRSFGTGVRSRQQYGEVGN